MSLTASGSDLAEAFGLVEGPSLSPRYNIAPGQLVSAVRIDPTVRRRTLASLHWGFLPSWTPDRSTAGPINARSETAATRATFRDSFRGRRCLLPASGFYEWKREDGQRQPYYFTRKDGRLMALAGLWDHWQGPGAELDSFAILTTDANEVVAPIHDRMPVSIPSEAFDLWLDPRTQNLRELRRLLSPSPADLLLTHPVSTLVNKPENDSPACIEPQLHPPGPTQGSLF